MSFQDPIADLLTRVRNAQDVRKPTVNVPASKQKAEILKVLRDEGYIENFEVIDSEEHKPTFTITLKYFNNKPVIESIKRVSKSSLRKYVKKDALPQVEGGLGIAIISTSQGLMTDREARKRGFGGEVLCTVF